MNKKFTTILLASVIFICGCAKNTHNQNYVVTKENKKMENKESQSFIIINGKEYPIDSYNIEKTLHGKVLKFEYISNDNPILGDLSSDAGFEVFKGDKVEIRKGNQILFKGKVVDYDENIVDNQIHPICKGK